MTFTPSGNLDSELSRVKTVTLKEDLRNSWMTGVPRLPAAYPLLVKAHTRGEE